MNLILESILNEELIKETQSKSDLEFLDEYLAARRGINLSEAKHLILMVEDEKQKGMKAITEVAKKKTKKVKKTYSNKKKGILGSLLPKNKKQSELERLKVAAQNSLSGIKNWTRKKIKNLKKMSGKKKLAIAGAAIGVPAALGGLKAYADHRRAKREEY